MTVIKINGRFLQFSALHNIPCVGENDDCQLFQSPHFYSLQNREPQISNAQTWSGNNHQIELYKFVFINCIS